ncbi:MULTISPECIES: MFS transporter [unclassified Luteibacter]|uniref:NTP/NDP exchange transporter n=1 Tax=unclassified Luteibacter TaxID=2620188 RepID=UPI0008BDCF77|nr:MULTISPECIES: MFS transporter [unclassified Luteibacter]SEP05280.1 ATP:ADP antiporter, AAA family [Luteibacter sp. UNC138MFCol5.1]SEW17101.1 ATP:ADP antiporter, AAA family [Luteibacter sp. 329MFSha]
MNPPAGAARTGGLTLALSVIGFFLVLTSYYVLRPVRDQLVGAAGSSSLPMFYAVVFVVMLALTPVFGWLVARFPRRRVLLGSYLSFVLCLFAFVPAFVAQDRIGAVALGQVFFVWVSVFNLFVVSLFWSLMADVYRSAEARLVFPIIAFGGMAGALLGPLLTRLLVVRVGVPSMLVVSAVTLLLALGALLVVLQRADANDRGENAPLGGSIIEGAKAAISQPFLRYMTLLMLFSDGIATMAYALMADYTKAHFTDNAARTAFYADLDLWINGLGAVLQLTLTPLLMRRVGTAWALVLPSVVNCVLLAWLAFHGPGDTVLFGFAVPLIAIVQIATRGLTFGMSKPAVDALYTRIPREARYKGKNFIETTVWRFGDLLVTSGLQGLRALGVGIAGIGILCATLAALAVEVARRAATSPDLEPESDERRRG